MEANTDAAIRWEVDQFGQTPEKQKGIHVFSSFILKRHTSLWEMQWAIGKCAVLHEERSGSRPSWVFVLCSFLKIQNNNSNAKDNNCDEIETKKNLITNLIIVIQNGEVTNN